MAGGAADDDEWELCNDDGFVYKRRKRRQPEDGTHLAAPSSARPPTTDHEAELRRNLLLRRKLSLMALRDRYRSEIQQWEGLVASLQGGGGGSGGGLLQLAMEEPSQRQVAASGALSTSRDHQQPDEVLAPENPFRTLVDELVLQVEIQETILKKLSNICDIVDKACNRQEEAMMESLLDLPVWRSPRTLMSSLMD